MCLLAILSRVSEDAPLILAANREEEYQRRGTPPQVGSGRRGYVACRDLRAGGTWLGINEASVVVAVVNRPTPPGLQPQRSRGLLALEMLEAGSAAEAVRLALAQLPRLCYAPCLLLAADPANTFVVQHGEWDQVWPLPAGIHVLTRFGINASADPRAARAMAWLNSQRLSLARSWLELAQEVCRAGPQDGQPALCWHGEQAGTVSSTLLALRQPLRDSVLLHAQGPPDAVPYEDYSALLRVVSQATPAERDIGTIL
jgi:hypothetical protein